jgi:hypothetical protein
MIILNETGTLFKERPFTPLNVAAVFGVALALPKKPSGSITMLVVISLSAGVVTLLVSIEQKSVQLKIPVEFVIVTSCKQVTFNAVFAVKVFAVTLLIVVLRINVG